MQHPVTLRRTRVQTRLQQSVNTYEQISNRLDDFYETPEETANSGRDSKVDELNRKLAEAEAEKNRMASREEMMERSYRMAARYLNPDKDTVQAAAEEEPAETVPVRRAELQTASGLSQPVADSAFIASLAVERNYGFNTAVGSSYQMGTNTIAACISENQTIERGRQGKTQVAATFASREYHRSCQQPGNRRGGDSGERLDILVSSIEYAGNIIPVQLATYDVDGQKGILFPVPKPGTQ